MGIRVMIWRVRRNRSGAERRRMAECYRIGGPAGRGGGRGGGERRDGPWVLPPGVEKFTPLRPAC